MNKVLIIGAGFGGLAVARKLCRFKKDLEVTLIDKKKESHFLPVLPDIIGRKISPEFLMYDIGRLSKKWGFKFINEEAVSLDREKRKIKSRVQELSYDYLIICSGSETNFYGNEQVRNNAYKMDNVYDAAKILEVLEQNDFDNYIICGGGYTGIEIATNLRRYLAKKVKNKRIIIVELAPSILGPLPEWMKEYTSKNLKRLDIEVILNTSLDRAEDNRVILSDGKIFDNSLLIWSAGVKVSDFVNKLDFEKGRQGRLSVDSYLRLDQRCFAVGDCAQFAYQESLLRMAVQFSIAQGYCAASNIIRSIKGGKLKRYRPMDLGYIIPMANNKSCGKILGVNMHGFIPTILHYLMCVYRTIGFKNKAGIIKDLMTGGVR